MNMTITITYFKAGSYEKETITFKGEAHEAYQASSDWRFQNLHTRIYNTETKFN